jgi:hypothetical protein
MKPVAITFVDEKFKLLAAEQKTNFNKFNIEHVTIPIKNQRYNIFLWIDLLDETISAIKKYGKIFRVDSEIQLLQEIPIEWEINENTLFFIEPIVRTPWYIAINTGHMILSESAIPFLECLKTMSLSLIPPNYENEKLGFDDEDLTAPALAVTKMPYHREVIEYNRHDESTARCTRGYWYTKHTVITHPFIHNWNTPNHVLSDLMMFRNHFMPNASVKQVDAVLLGMRSKTNSENYWKKFEFEKCDTYWKKDQWLINPFNSSFSHTDYGNFKQPYPL